EKFYTAIPKIKSELYDEVVREGFFKTSPERTRNSYAALGMIGLVGTAVLGFCGLAALSELTTDAICLPVALGVFFMGLIFLARFMPSKTPAGSEASARWKAFKRYLDNIEKYTNLEESQQIFDKYLPYAIAFGLERSYVRKFAAVQTPAPPWYYPVHVPYGYYGPRRTWDTGRGETGRGLGRAAPPYTAGREGVPAPSLDSATDSMFGGLESMSNGLFSMLDSAARTLSSAPQPSSSSSGSRRGFSGRGWSGGGGIGGGGGGRGSAGFG
ncbi:MAG: DUF2207 domain-containing protein, partial [Anaerolineae bacterium]|nr:DUF2207 domain-containing protein [Anaerolineae bacterium]